MTDWCLLFFCSLCPWWNRVREEYNDGTLKRELRVRIRVTGEFKVIIEIIIVGSRGIGFNLHCARSFWSSGSEVAKFDIIYLRHRPVGDMQRQRKVEKTKTLWLKKMKSTSFLTFFCAEYESTANTYANPYGGAQLQWMSYDNPVPLIIQLY